MNHSHFVFALLLAPAVVFGCGPGEGAAPLDAGRDAAPPPADAGPADAGPAEVDAGPPVCGTGGGSLPDALETLRGHDGAAAASIGEQDWAISVGGSSYRLAEEVVWEQARFGIDRPTRIHGFRVQWAGVPEGAAPSDELEAGLYPDFGHNGFDMWRFDPYWTGTRCVEDLEPDGWVTYALSEPVEIAQASLVYVGHRRDGPGAPSFWFDGSTDADGECERFDACRAGLNLPDAETSSFFNGVSFPFPYDFMVELIVERIGEVPEETVFQPVEGIALSKRVAFGDFDADGWDDLVTHGPTLHRNRGDGTFEDVTAASGIAGFGARGSAVWGDYDNDGCLDLFVFAESLTRPDALLRNACDGTFTDATDAAGITDLQSYEDCGDPANVRSPSHGAAWLDVDADGFLDLYVANYTCSANGEAYRDTVFRNRGDGTFEEWTGMRGFATDRTASRGAAPIDADRDGDVDLLVNNYRLQRNLFFANGGDGTVVDTALELGLAGHADRLGSATYFGHTIGVAWGDLDRDGDFDAVQANLAHPRFFQFSDKTQVLMQTEAGSFVDNAGDWSFPAGENGLRFQETHSVPGLGDFDRDGHLDLVITAVYDGRPTDFYWGNGDGTFRLDVLGAGITTENGWGVATSDWDRDGDLDLATRTLFTNERPGPGHFLDVRVVGNVSANRAAIGAVVSVEAGGVVQLRQVQGGTGQGCQDSMYLHFGLGSATTVGPIEVTFPGGRTVRFDGPFEADQRLWLFEDGTVHAGWAPPP